MRERITNFENHKQSTAEVAPQVTQSYDMWTRSEADIKFEADKKGREALMEAARRAAANRVLDQITNMEQSLLSNLKSDQLARFKHSRSEFEALKRQL